MPKIWKEALTVTQPDASDPYDFEVKSGETITFSIKIFGTNPHIILVEGGSQLSPPFSFTVDKTLPHIHVVETEFDFDDSPPPTARYEISVSGSFGGDFAVP